MPTLERPSWPTRLSGVSDLPFVGRASEMRHIDAAWVRACEGRRQVVFVGGEPGAGKSRLVATAAEHHHRTGGAAVTLGLCFPDLATPFQPIAEVLDHLLREDATGLVAATDRRVIDQLAVLVDGLVDDDRSPFESPFDDTMAPDGRSDRRRRLFDAVVSVVRAASERWPLLMILEDLHWGGAPTAQLLAHLVRTTATERFLVVATHRLTAPDRSDDLAATIAQLHHFDGVQHLELPGLDVHAVAQLLAAFDGHTGDPEDAAQELMRRTGGNPFLLRELFRHMESLEAPSDRADGSASLPPSVADTMALRLAAMPLAGVAVVELAALAGDPVDPSLLVAARDGALEETLGALDLGVDAGLLRPLGDGSTRYAFVHDLARQALIERIPAARRAALHARLASAIESSGVPLSGRSHRLARHWSRAGPYDTDGRSVHWLAEAAREAARSLAYEEACALLEQASSRLGPDDPQHSVLVLEAATNAVRGGAFADARRLYEQLADTDDPVVLARAAIGYEDASWRPGLLGDRAVELLVTAERQLDADHPLRVPLLAALGRALAFIGRADQAEAVGTHAIELARLRGDERMLATALLASLWGFVNWPLANRMCRDRAREGGELAESLGDWELLGQAASQRGPLGYMAGSREEWREGRVQMEVAHQRSGQPFYAYLAGCSDWALAYITGDFDRAKRLSLEMVELGEAFGSGETDGVYGVQRFMVQRALGELDAVRPLITGEEALDGSHWLPGLLALYTAFDQRPGMRRVTDQLLDSDLEAEHLTPQWGAIAAFLTEAIVALGDVPAARRLLPLLEPYAGRNLGVGHFVAVFGSAHRYLAMLHQVMGSPEAEEHFLEAYRMDEAMEAPVHVTETLARHGDLLAARGDPAGAAARHAEAHRLADRLGMADLVARTAPVGRRVPTARVAPDGGSTPFTGLTARELEVLRCLAEGASNREIAGTLFIAENTVANHVRNIMAKTGAANRTQAAMYAMAHSLVGLSSPDQ